MENDTEYRDTPIAQNPSFTTESQLSSVQFDKWLQTIIHTHSMLGPSAYLANKTDEQNILQYWQDGQFTTRHLIDTLTQMAPSKGGFNFVDTEHAAHSLEVYHPALFPGKTPAEVRDMRRDAFLPENLPHTRALASERILMRANAIKKLLEQHPKWKDKVYTGVEIDVLRGGQYDITPEALAELDINGASIHRDEFRDSNNGDDPTLSEVVQIYESIADDPLVDVINHCARELSEKVLQQITKNPEVFDNVFVLMAKNEKALEINLRDLVDPKRRENARLALVLAKRAKDRGVRLTLGSDFHRIEQYLPTSLPNGRTQQSVSTITELKEFAKDDQFFASHNEAEINEKNFENLLCRTFDTTQGDLFPTNVLKLARPIYQAIRQIQEAGINSEDIVNGTNERFRIWATRRKELKKAHIEEQEILARIESSEK